MHQSSFRKGQPGTGLLKASAGKGILCHLIVLLLIASIFSASGQTVPIYQQADSQFELKQFDSAIVVYNRMIDSFPAKKEGYYNRGLCYFGINNLVAAQHDFTTCLQIDSVFNDAIFMNCLTLQKQGRWYEANHELNRLNTTYAGYNELKKRVRYHNISVLLSRNWYYMIAIMFLFIILVGLIAKSYAVRRGY